MKMKLIAIAAIFQLSLLSCKKEAASDANASFSYELKTANQSSSLNRLIGTGRTEAVTIQWTAGTASANLIKFEAKNSGGEIEFKQNVTQQIDLFAATSTLGNITIPQGTYSEVEFKAYLAPSGTLPALELTGILTSGTTAKTIIFRVNSNIELKAEKSNVTVASGAIYSALNTIDLSALTRGMSEADFTNATLTNGQLLISANSNSNIYSAILNNLNKHHGEAEVHHH
ncbi:MAG: hypothetical protein JWR72_3584 [Flavisolibacter sp.]|jgi:hypothetical protein|nr:hypothetical protein [Flavisolibacter sp.]